MRKQWQLIGTLGGIACLCCTSGCVMGQGNEAPQYPQYVQYPQGAPPVVPAGEVLLTPEQLDGLLAPIALYPDPLLSLIFPAATYPQDVVAAEQWLQSAPNPTEADIAAQGWDASVKGLTHYPSVLKMMSAQIDWTQALGASFARNQQDVLDSVQRLRAQAQSARNLQSTPQVEVLVDNGAIRIEPADPEIIYVPQYDPEVVYYSAYPISFGIGFPIGLWCDNDFDWRSRYIMVGGGWYTGWHHPDAWDRRRPGWDRDHHPAGRGGDTPRRWVRTASRPAPRITPATVSHLRLDQPHRGTDARPAPVTARPRAALLPVGNQPSPVPSRNVFGSSESGAEAQRAAQRARPAPVQQPAETVRPPPSVRPEPAPRPAVVTPPPRAAPVAPTPRPPVETPTPRVTPAPNPPVREAPAQVEPRAAPNNVFHGGSAVETRAQSDRGKKSRRDDGQ